MNNYSLKYTICFIRKVDQLLLLNRRSAPNMGLWNGVGGKIEAGETPSAGILREIREETGISFDEVKFSGLVTWTSPTENSGMYVYTAEVPADFHYVTPVKTDEGILDWKDLSWILNPENDGIVSNMRRFLPAMLNSDKPVLRRHHFHYNQEDVLCGYEVFSLDELVSMHT